MIFLNFTFTDIILILVIALIVFGPGKMPEIGQKLGRGLADFRNMTSKFSETVNDETNKIKKEMHIDKLEEMKSDILEVTTIKKEDADSSKGDSKEVKENKNI